MFLASQFSVSLAVFQHLFVVVAGLSCDLRVKRGAFAFGGFRQIHALSHYVHFSVGFAGQWVQCLVKDFVCFYSPNVRAFECASAGLVQSLGRRGVHDSGPGARFVRILRFASADAFVRRLPTYGTAAKQRGHGDCSKRFSVGHSVSSLSGLGV
jgi:hypothetical protein